MTIKLNCKVQGCAGLRRDGEIYSKGLMQGFCTKHYNQYKKGLLDINGSRIPRPGKALSSAVCRTLTVLHKNDQVDKKIDQEIQNNNTLFSTPVNQEFHGNIHKIKDTRQFIQSRKFVISNIEHLTNIAIQKIYDESTGYIPKKDPQGIPAIDEAKIAKMIKEGKSDEVILLKIRGKYTLARIRNFRKLLKDKKLI